VSGTTLRRIIKKDSPQLRRMSMRHEQMMEMSSRWMMMSSRWMMMLIDRPDNLVPILIVGSRQVLANDVPFCYELYTSSAWSARKKN
jgi:hypothetical protein